MSRSSAAPRPSSAWAAASARWPGLSPARWVKAQTARPRLGVGQLAAERLQRRLHLQPGARRPGRRPAPPSAARCSRSAARRSPVARRRRGARPAARDVVRRAARPAPAGRRPAARRRRRSAAAGSLARQRRITSSSGAGTRREIARGGGGRNDRCAYSSSRRSPVNGSRRVQQLVQHQPQRVDVGSAGRPRRRRSARGPCIRACPRRAGDASGRWAGARFAGGDSPKSISLAAGAGRHRRPGRRSRA